MELFLISAQRAFGAIGLLAAGAIVSSEIFEDSPLRNKDLRMWLIVIIFSSALLWLILEAISRKNPRAKLKLSFDPKDTYNRVSLHGGGLGFFTHVKVENRKRVTAQKTTAHITTWLVKGTDDKFYKHPGFMAPVTVKWANARSVEPCEIEKGTPRRMDLVHAVDFQPDQLLLFTDPKQHAGVTTQFPLGQYRARVQVSAKNAKSIEGYFEITFKNWDDIRVERMKKFDIPEAILPAGLSALSASIRMAPSEKQPDIRSALLDWIRKGQEILDSYQFTYLIGNQVANGWADKVVDFLSNYVSTEATERFLLATDETGLTAIPHQMEVLRELADAYKSPPRITASNADVPQGPSV